MSLSSGCETTTSGRVLKHFVAVVMDSLVAGLV